MLDEEYLHTTTAGLISLVLLYEEKNKYLAGHSRQTADLAFALGQALDLPPTEIKLLQVGALLHRVGILKMAPEMVSPDGEFDLLRFETLPEAPAISAEMLEPVPGIKQLTDIVQYHHEWVDGSGRHGLDGNKIPLCARIVGLCEGFSIFTQDRPDRPSLKPIEALERIREESYKRYDGHLVTIFGSILGLS